MSIRRTGTTLLAAAVVFYSGLASAELTVGISYKFEPPFPGFPPVDSWSNGEHWDPTICLEFGPDGKCVVKGYPNQQPVDATEFLYYDVYVNNNEPSPFGPATLNMGVTASLASVNIGPDVVLNVAGGLGLNWWQTNANNEQIPQVAKLSNSGEVNVYGQIYSNALMQFDGPGIVELMSPDSAINGSAASAPTFTNNSRIAGTGQILSPLLNNNLITANQGSLPLIVKIYSPVGDQQRSVNKGTLRAGSGGTLDLSRTTSLTGTLDNRDGRIEALDASTVRLDAHVIGGTLDTSGSGVIRVVGNYDLTAVTNDGMLQIANGVYAMLKPGELQPGISGVTHNNGTILIDSTSLNTTLGVGGGVVLDGTGSLKLTNNRSNVAGGGVNSVLRNGANHTIEGAGQLGTFSVSSNTLKTIINEGTVDANLTGGRLTMRAGALDGIVDIANSGVLQASNGGVLEIYLSDVGNTGAIRALAGSLVDLNGARVTGGVLETAGGGMIKARTGAVLTDVTNNGLLGTSGMGLGAGTLTNTNRIDFAFDSATTSFGAIAVTGNVLVAGTGVLDMAPNSTDVTLARIRSSAGGVLTNGADHTIQGSGYIGYGGNLGVINNGLIMANKSTELTIYADAARGGFTNHGTVRAEAGSNLIIGANLVNYDLPTQTMNGGTYEAIGTIRLPSGNSIRNNAAHIILDGPVSNLYAGAGQALAGFDTNLAAGSFEILNGRNFSTAGDFTNAGAMRMGAGSMFTVGGPGIYGQTAGSTIVDGTLQAAGGLFLWGGSISGSGTIAGSIYNNGAIGPGSSPGSLAISGDFAQSGTGLLDIEIGGLLPGSEYDVLANSGAANLAGTLRVSLFDFGSGLFSPSAGDSFDILTALVISGTFATLDLAPLGSGLDWTVHYLTNFLGDTDVVRLSVVATAPAPIPLPPAAWLLLTGLAGLAAAARKRTKGR